MRAASVILVVLLAVPLAAVVAITVLVARRPAPAPTEAAHAAVRHARWIHAIGWLAVPVGVPVALLLAQLVGLPGISRVGFSLAVLGVLLFAAFTWGESTWPRPTGTVRRAPLVRRSARDLAPRVHVAFALAAVALTVVALVASALARTGRASYGYSPETGGATSVEPEPWWSHTAWYLGGAAVVLIGLWLTLRLIARRPAIVGTDTAWDGGLRQLSASRAGRMASFLLGLTSGYLLLDTGSTANTMGRLDGCVWHTTATDSGVEGWIALPCEATAANPFLVLGAAGMVLGGLVLIAAVVLTVVPARPPHGDGLSDGGFAPDREPVPHSESATDPAAHAAEATGTAP